MESEKRKEAKESVENLCLMRDNLSSSPDSFFSSLPPRETRDNGLGLEVIWWQQQQAVGEQPTTDT